MPQKWRSVALFPHATGSFNTQTKQALFSSYRRGISVDTLAKRFHRTRTSIYRVLNEVRAQRLLSQPLEYIHHPSFDDPAAEGIDDQHEELGGVFLTRWFGPASFASTPSLSI